MNDDAVLDARVRRGLQSLPVPDEQETAAALGEITGRRHRPARAPWQVALAAAVVVGLLVLGPQLIRALLVEERREPVSPVGELRGTWSRIVDGAQDPRWDGTWTVRFGDRGVLTLSPPRTIDAGTDGAAFALSGSQVRVDAFVNGVCYEHPPGTYSWSRSAEGLRLTAVDDACAPRAELLTGTWTELP